MSLAALSAQLLFENGLTMSVLIRPADAKQVYNVSHCRALKMQRPHRHKLQQRVKSFLDHNFSLHQDHENKVKSRSKQAFIKFDTASATSVCHTQEVFCAPRSLPLPKDCGPMPSQAPSPST